MRSRSFIAISVSLAVLLVGAVGLYLYDRGRRDTLAAGVKIAGVDVSGMKTKTAAAKVRGALTTRLDQPIVVAYGRTRFTLRPRAARVGYDVQATIDDALARSRQGNIFSRTWRSLTGGRIRAELTPKVSYSHRAVTRFVDGVANRIDRPAQDATIGYSASGLSKVPGHDGRRINARQLRNGVVFDIENQRFEGTLRPLITRTKPSVTTADLARKYPTIIIVNRNSFQLQLYKRLKLAKTYGIAVGQAGLDTPAGLHQVTDMTVNPSWNVPNESWAGSLAGQTIPAGSPDNPIKARWIGFYPGDGIHGTADVGSIGTAASHGCIRMRVSDVEELYDRVSLGDPVYVI